MEKLRKPLLNVQFKAKVDKHVNGQLNVGLHYPKLSKKAPKKPKTHRSQINRRRLCCNIRALPRMFESLNATRPDDFNGSGRIGDCKNRVIRRHLNITNGHILEWNPIEEPIWRIGVRK